MHDRFGFIGLGAMGSAIIKGLTTGGMEPRNIIAFDSFAEKKVEAQEKFGVKAADDAQTVAKEADIIILAVKPQDIDSVAQEIASALHDGKVVVSIAAGVSIFDIEKCFDGKIGVIRVMPNTPCLVGEGAMAVSAGKHVTESDLELVANWLKKIGVVHVVPEKLMDAVTGVSGSGPAYVYMMIEALADGGVMAGLPRKMALDLAAQTVLGAAKMVMETGEHPAVLSNMVTSPGGTTAAGLYALEKGGLRSTIQDAVQAAVKRSKELGN